jgi:phasin family protein
MADTVTGSFFNTANGSYESLRKISALNLKALTKLAGLQFELATLGLETSVAQVKLLAASKGYDQLYAQETVLASLYGSRIAEISRETTDVLLKSGDELNVIIGQIFSVAKQGMAVEVATAAPDTVKQQAEVKAVTSKPARRKAARKKK